VLLAEGPIADGFMTDGFERHGCRQCERVHALGPMPNKPSMERPADVCQVKRG